MPHNRQLCKETFLQLLKSAPPFPSLTDKQNGKREAMIFEISSQTFQIECDDGADAEQVRVTLKELHSAAGLEFDRQFESLPECLKWLQRISQANFGAVTSLESYSDKITILRIAAEQSEIRRAVQSSRVPKRAYGNLERILLVEDEDNVRFIVAAMLNNLNYAVTSCSDGVEALRELEKSDFDLALIDAMTPRLSGAELLKRCNEVRPSMRTVLMTGCRRNERGEEERDGVLYKPFDLMTLALRLRKELSKDSVQLEPVLQ